MISTAVDKQLWTPVILEAGRSLVLKLKSMKTQLLAGIICQLLDVSDAYLLFAVISKLV